MGTKLFNILQLITMFSRSTASFWPTSTVENILGHVVTLLGFSPAKIDSHVYGNLTSVPSFLLHDSQISVQFPSSNTLQNWSNVSSRRESVELPLVNFFIPPSIHHAAELLDHISVFFDGNPDQTPLVFYFILWPEVVRSAEDDVKPQLMATLPKAPLNSHLHVVVMTFTLNGISRWELWEFYTIKGLQMFQSINMEARAGEFLRMVVRRGNFGGVAIKGFVYPESILPVKGMLETVNGSVVASGQSGLAVESFRVLQSSLNFRMEYIVSVGFMWHDKYSDLTGTATQLLNHEGDIVLSFNTEILPFRVEKLSCSHPVISHRVEAYYKKLDANLRRNVLTKSFSLSLWAAVIGTVALSYICFLMFEKFQRRYDPRKTQPTTTPFLWTIAAFCQQGWEYTSANVSTRIVSLVTLVASFLYYTAFSASIVSILSVDTNPIRDTQDLLDRGYTLYGNSYSITGLQYAMHLAEKDGVPRESRRLKTDEPIIPKLNNSKSALVNIRFVLIALGIRENHTLQELCTWLDQTKLSGDASHKQMGAIFFRKFDPLKKFIDYQLTRWRDNGLMVHYREMFDQTPAHQCDPPRKEPRELSLDDLWQAYHVLTVGILSSLIILSCEKARSTYKSTTNDLARTAGPVDVSNSTKLACRVPATKAFKLQKAIRRRICGDAIKRMKKFNMTKQSLVSRSQGNNSDE